MDGYSKKWTHQRKRVLMLIKQVSEQHGGDEPKWLAEYAKDIIETYKDDLQKVIDSLLTLHNGSDKSTPIIKRRPFKVEHCKLCGCISPFCEFKTKQKCSNNDRIDKRTNKDCFT